MLLDVKRKIQNGHAMFLAVKLTYDVDPATGHRANPQLELVMNPGGPTEMQVLPII